MWSKLAAEVVIKIGVQLLFWLGGGGWVGGGQIKLISTQVEVVVEGWLEKVLKINFHGWVSWWVAGWVEVGGFN